MLALVASIAVIVALLGSALTTEGEMTNDPESYRGYDAIAEHFPFDPAEAVNELVVVRSARATVDAPAFRKHVEDLEFELQASGHVESARDVYATGDRSLVSPDGHATVIPLFLGPSGEDGIGELVAIVDAAERDGFETAITGEFTADEDYQRLSEEDLQKGEFQFGIPAALIVLLLVFGSIVAGLVPVLTALVAIVVALALTALVGQAFDLSVFVVNMLTGMGLALGIDYALFIVSRYREERNRGRAELGAARRDCRLSRFERRPGAARLPGGPPGPDRGRHHAVAAAAPVPRRIGERRGLSRLPAGLVGFVQRAAARRDGRRGRARRLLSGMRGLGDWPVRGGAARPGAVPRGVDGRMTRCP